MNKVFPETHLNPQQTIYANGLVDPITMLTVDHRQWQAKEVRIQARLESLSRKQESSALILAHLKKIMKQLDTDCQPFNQITQTSLQDLDYRINRNCGHSRTSSSLSLASLSPSTSSTSSANFSSVEQITRCSEKRKISSSESGYDELSCEDDGYDDDGRMTLRYSQQHQKQQFARYPQQIGEKIILGPNGTEIDKKLYDGIVWSSAAAATRQLLGVLFTSDILATHSLTGKPSPAFYGRERPPKMQLDPEKTADIIHLIRSRFDCTIREVRAAITTKCSDISKKYKRRQQKHLADNSVNN